MTQNNNLSVLPFYTDIELQNHRKSYAFGAIYPLYAPNTRLLPFQFIREARTSPNRIELPITQSFSSSKLNAAGNVIAAEDGFDVAEYDVTDLDTRDIYLVLKKPSEIFYENAIFAVALNSDGYVVNRVVSSALNYIGVWNIPDDATKLRVQRVSFGDIGQVKAQYTIIRPIQQVLLYDKNDTYIGDITESMIDNGLKVTNKSTYNVDLISYIPETDSLTLEQGQYYISISDGVDRWYSDIITIVNDITPYLKIEWYDIEDVIADGGFIFYENPDYRNILYLCAELGKPEYPFEEDSEERNGYLFPLKQISKKTYRFTFLASEFLCDVMRLIRMADVVKIVDKYGREYNVTEFLLTPTWQTQGDLASVEVEFSTHTVIKKNAKAF